MYVETERERERERLQRISEHENKKGGSSPLCVYNIRESESVCESEKESKKERERERRYVCQCMRWYDTERVANHTNFLLQI